MYSTLTSSIYEVLDDDLEYTCSFFARYVQHRIFLTVYCYSLFIENPKTEHRHSRKQIKVHYNHSVKLGSRFVYIFVTSRAMTQSVLTVLTCQQLQ